MNRPVGEWALTEKVKKQSKLFLSRLLFSASDTVQTARMIKIRKRRRLEGQGDTSCDTHQRVSEMLSSDL